VCCIDQLKPQPEADSPFDWGSATNQTGAMSSAYRSGCVLVLASAFALGGCAVSSHYSAEGIDARVVDSETKQPIAGALVVAMWTLVGGPGYSIKGVLKVEETTTDDMGRFQISAWGPIPRPDIGVLDVLDPEFVILKHGYFLGHASNYVGPTLSPERAKASIRTSNWNGRDIELERDKGDQMEVGRFVGGFGTLDRLVYNSPDCKWKKLPKTVRAFEKERIYQRTITRKDFDVAIPDLSSMLLRPECRPTDEFMRAYNEIP